MMKQYIGK